MSIEEIKAMLAPIAEKYRVEAILLFGSYAKGNANEQSDVDLIVFNGAEFHPTDIFAMAEEIRSVLHKHADVYEIREINPGTLFYNTIFQEPGRGVCCVKYTDEQHMEKICDYSKKLETYLSDYEILLGLE